MLSWRDQIAVFRAGLILCAGSLVLSPCAAFAASDKTKPSWQPTVKRVAAVAQKNLPGKPARKHRVPPEPKRDSGRKPNGKSVAAPRLPLTTRTGVAAPKTKEPAGLTDPYCANITDQAADARYVYRTKKIAELEQQLEGRMAKLDAKAKVLQKWLARRDAFIKKAHDSLVGIYAKMRPDAAALQLAKIDMETVSAIVTQLGPRKASAILSEMEPEIAARVGATIAGAAAFQAKAGGS